MFWIVVALVLAGLVCLLILCAGAYLEEHMDDEYENDEP